jgi:hypothetical protein
MINGTTPLLGGISAATVAVGNAVTLAAIVGLAIYGWQQGLYVATLLALASLASFAVAFGCTHRVADFLVAAELPPAHAPAAAFFLMAVGLAIGVRMAIGRWIPEQAVWAGSLGSRLAAMVLGGWAGFIVAGGLLVGWSLAELPASLRIAPHDLALDPGRAVLATYVRLLGNQREGRSAMLHGNEAFPRSETFSDANRNAMYDVGERYRDLDGDRAFTERLASSPVLRGDIEWRPGLLDCYLLADWSTTMALQPPRISSTASATVDFADLRESTLLYQAEARDPNRDDAVSFSITATGDGVEGNVVIDSATGQVSLTPEAMATPRNTYQFMLTATDRAGLEDCLSVKVTVRGIPLQTSP